MLKFLMFISFMNFMLWMGNKMKMFYYNLYYLVSMFMLLSFMMKDYLIWGNVSFNVGISVYSMMLMILSVWVVALMMMSLEEWSMVKGMVFINLSVVLLLFFSFMDLFMFYVVFEVSLIPTFFLIIYWGSNPERLSAAIYMMLYMLLISFPLLVYIFDVYLFMGTCKFSLMLLVSSYEVSFWGFLMLYLPFFIKLPMYIFHIWLPKAHVEAPVYGSMILAGVLLKMGGYGLIRFLEIFYDFSVKFSSMILGLSIVGSVVTSLLCLVQVDMKSMVAYSSVVHMNLMLGSMMTLMKVGILGGYVMMISHGLCSSGMFYMVNLFYKRSGSRLLILNKGLISSIPSVMMWWFFFCIMNFSFPFSLNFVGEIMMLMNILSWSGILMLNLIMICFFSGAYSLYLFSYIYHGKNYYYENYIYSCSVMEYMVLVMHLFPLVGFLLNLDYFI